MPTLVSLLVLISFSIWEQPKGVHKPTDSSTQTKNGPAQDRDSLLPAPLIVKQVQISQDAADHDKPNAQKVSDFINSCSTAVIALFTILTFFVFRNQLQATKVSERAWMVSKAVSSLPTFASKSGTPKFEIRFLCANTGRTPAWITAMGSRANLLAKGRDLPIEPDYDWAGPFPKEGTVLPPDANIPQGADISSQDLANIDTGAVSLYFYGAVRYRDIFGQKHETRYCYVFKPQPTAVDPSPRDFYIGGPPAYNRAT